MSPTRPPLSIQLPPVNHFPYYSPTTTTTMPKTPEAQQHEPELAIDPPPPPRPQTFKVRRKRHDLAMRDSSIIPTIEMSEVETQMSSPTLQPTSAHLLSPLPLSSVRAFTPPKTPAPRLCTPFNQLDAAADEWDLIANAKPTYQRANSVCSSFSDSSISSCGSSAFSMPTGGYDTRPIQPLAHHPGRCPAIEAHQNPAPCAVDATNGRPPVDDVHGVSLRSHPHPVQNAARQYPTNGRVRPGCDQGSTNVEISQAPRRSPSNPSPSMQPDGLLAQMASDEPPPAPRPSELQIHARDMNNRTSSVLASPFVADSATSRSHLLHSMATTRSLGRTEFNGRSLDSPFDFKVGAPTDRRSRKRRFRSDEEKPRRGALEDVFGPPVEQRPLLRNRGFSVGTALGGEHLANLFTPSSAHTVDYVMADAAGPGDDAPMGSRSAPRRMIEPVPRLLSPFVETPPPSRQSNTFPRGNLLPTVTNQAPFHQQLLQLQHEHASNMAQRS
ncbi:hypothetical protein BST61_g10899 [Cercospora zeina]